MLIRAYKGIVKKGKEQALEMFFSEQQSKMKEQYFDTGRIMNANVFLLEQNLYVYLESVEEEVFPEMLLAGAENFLEVWPDTGSAYALMTNIFHFQEPISKEHWQRKQKPDFMFGMIANLKPEHIARYIFYHYQFQEERPGVGDKYSNIFLHGSNAFFYGEMPEVLEPAPYERSLKTDNTPDDEIWQSLMGSHFIWWDESYPECNIKEYDWEKDGYPLGQRNNQWLYAKNILSICG